jgi:hypothetical protein
MSDRRVKCWGGIETSDGLLGNRPLEVPHIQNAVHVGVGYGYACALVIAGEVYCWGAQGYGSNLGGSLLSWYGNTLPVPVSGVSGAVKLSVDGYHSCAVKSDSTVWCWGYNIASQLGSGVATGGPIQVPGISDAIDVSAGFNHSCALRANGTVRCWGFYRPGFRDIVGVSGVTAIVSDSGPCVRLANGTTRCYSFDVDTESLVPEKVTLTTGEVAIELSSMPTTRLPNVNNGSLCVIDSFSRVVCMGSGGGGLLGNGGLADSPVATFAVGVSDATYITGNTGARCVVVSGGRVKCWGRGESGNLGERASGFQQVPVTVIRAEETTVSIPSTLPAPSETYEPYVVNVSVARANAAPSQGFVKVRDDAGASCATAALDSLGNASCVLTSKLRGALTISAEYSPYDPLLAQSVGTRPQTVRTTCNLDVDGDGRIGATTDGIMILRAMLGLSDSQISLGVANPNGTRTSPATIAQHIRGMLQNRALDLDQNTAVFAETDGVMLLRVLFGFRGSAVADGVYGFGYPWDIIREHLNTVCGLITD